MASSDDKVTDAQWFKLMDIVSVDNEMRTNQFLEGPNGKIRLQKKWDNAAKIINNVSGSVKTGNQWRTAFSGLKSRARKAASAREAYLKGTGGGECADDVNLGLSDVHKRVLRLIGTVSVHGVTKVPDPFLVQSQLSPKGNQNDLFSNPFTGRVNTPHQSKVGGSPAFVTPSSAYTLHTFEEENTTHWSPSPKKLNLSHTRTQTGHSLCHGSARTPSFPPRNHIPSASCTPSVTGMQVPKKVHTPPQKWNGNSPARKKLAFNNPNKGYEECEKLYDVAEQMSYVDLQCTNTTLNSKEAFGSLQETLEVMQASIAGLIESIDGLKEAVCRNTDAVRQFAVKDFCGALEGTIVKTEEIINQFSSLNACGGLKDAIHENTEALSQLSLQDPSDSLRENCDALLGVPIVQLTEELAKNTEAVHNTNPCNLVDAIEKNTMALKTLSQL